MAKPGPATDRSSRFPVTKAEFEVDADVEVDEQAAARGLMAAAMLEAVAAAAAAAAIAEDVPVEMALPLRRCRLRLAARCGLPAAKLRAQRPQVLPTHVCPLLITCQPTYLPSLPA
ncbi:hypothetical protein CBR_g26433 [Chara braunii]|uniref:Uncharacterized protein n=1 Tax=Chara braunii TaxID=69332 RepID=A0A388L7W9_CHABU|nr:hypothetical protein CBR_g26433 [Chara braunii]|eukprot:GBG78405.1 hypothetical protein CBR_g26433 [Chara braunii]